MAGLHASSIGCPMTTNTDEGRSDRPSVEEVTERMLEDSGFEGVLQALVETFMDSTSDAQDRAKAVHVFGILALKKSQKAEAGIIADREGE